MPRQYVIAGIVFCLIVSFACQAALAADPKRVLIIDSFGRDFAPWNEVSFAVRLAGGTRRCSNMPNSNGVVGNSLALFRWANSAAGPPMVTMRSSRRSTKRE